PLQGRIARRRASGRRSTRSTLPEPRPSRSTLGSGMRPYLDTGEAWRPTRRPPGTPQPRSPPPRTARGGGRRGPPPLRAGSPPLVTVGVLILLFVAYQLWGTGIYEARAQSDLESQFKRELAERGRTTSTTSPGASTSTSSPTTTPGVELPPVPADGDPVGEI